MPTENASYEAYVYQKDLGQDCCPDATKIAMPIGGRRTGKEKHDCNDFGYDKPVGCWNCEDDKILAAFFKKFCSIKCLKEYG